MDDRLQKPRNLIPIKKPEMQGAKFSRNEAYLEYAAVTGKLKQRRRSGFFSGIMDKKRLIWIVILAALALWVLSGGNRGVPT